MWNNSEWRHVLAQKTYYKGLWPKLSRCLEDWKRTMSPQLAVTNLPLRQSNGVLPIYPLYIRLLAPSLVARYYLRPALYFPTYPPGFQTGFCAVNTRWRLLKGNLFKELPCPEPSWELWCNVEKALIKSMHLTCIFLRDAFFYQSAFSPFHSIQSGLNVLFITALKKPG